MTQTVDFDLKQTVLANDTFGPREVRQMQAAIQEELKKLALETLGEKGPALVEKLSALK